MNGIKRQPNGDRTIQGSTEDADDETGSCVAAESGKSLRFVLRYSFTGIQVCNGFCAHRVSANETNEQRRCACSADGKKQGHYFLHSPSQTVSAAGCDEEVCEKEIGKHSRQYGCGTERKAFFDGGCCMFWETYQKEHSS